MDFLVCLLTVTLWYEKWLSWILQWEINGVWSGKRGWPTLHWWTDNRPEGLQLFLFLPGTVSAVVGSHCDVTEELPLGLLTAHLCEEQPYVKWRHLAPEITPICLFLPSLHSMHTCTSRMFTLLYITRSIWWYEKNSCGFKRGDYEWSWDGKINDSPQLNNILTSSSWRNVVK